MIWLKSELCMHKVLVQSMSNTCCTAAVSSSAGSMADGMLWIGPSALQGKSHRNFGEQIWARGDVEVERRPERLSMPDSLILPWDALHFHSIYRFTGSFRARGFSRLTAATHCNDSNTKSLQLLHSSNH